MTRDAGQSREDRLKKALKANLARRKAQARARQDEPADTPPEQTPAPSNGDDSNG